MTDHPEHQYLALLQDILDNGHPRDDRTGVGTAAVFGRQLRFDLSQGFPLLTTKKVHFKSIAAELLWFLRGDTNVRWLQEQGVTIWDEWADEKGDLGPVYGKQWRAWEAPAREDGHPCWEPGDLRTIDQIAAVIESIKTNPTSRRHIVSAWNVGQLDDMALAPCHVLFQFFVADGRLSCSLYQRSADVFLGLPFNIASYALLTHLIARVTDLEPGDLVVTLGDAHLYLNHVEQARKQLTRDVRPLPRLIVATKHDIDTFVMDDFALAGYEPHPAIKAPVAV